jgi:hypothetical protein
LKDRESPKISSIVPLLVSPESKEWLKELEDLRAENKALKEREENLNVITNKADFYAAEAKRLEELLKELKKEQESLQAQKTEREAEYKGVIAENEVLVQEVISSKLSLVDLSTELDVTKKACAQLRQKLGMVTKKVSNAQVNSVQNQMNLPSSGDRSQGGGVSRQQYSQQQQSDSRVRSQSGSEQLNNNRQSQRISYDNNQYSNDNQIKVQPVRRAPK